MDTKNAALNPIGMPQALRNSAAQISENLANLTAERDRLRAENAELVVALEYWLPKHRPFDGYVGSNDPECAAHNKKWDEARAAAIQKDEAVVTKLDSPVTHYERAPVLDKRIEWGSDFAGDAWVRWTAVGQRPEDNAQLLEDRRRLVEALETALTENIRALQPNERPIGDDPDWAIKARALLRELGEWS